MLQSVLFGNGFNLLTNGTPSWEALLEDISKDPLDKRIPNTLKYEAIIAREPYRNSVKMTYNGKTITYNGKVITYSGEVVESQLKKDIASRVKVFPTNDFYHRLAELPVSHYLTTNYDNTLSRSMGKEGFAPQNKSERLYSIWRQYRSRDSRFYWPIHGNEDSPASIMLGYDHYCGALGRINRYVKGTDSVDGNRSDSMESRLRNEKMEIQSWIDLFFCSDIHIIGLGLAYEEIDLWWLLNKRKRIEQQFEGLIKNHIFYYPVGDVSIDKRQLFGDFDVMVMDLESYERDFPYMYNVQLDRIADYTKGH